MPRENVMEFLTSTLYTWHNPPLSSLKMLFLLLKPSWLCLLLGWVQGWARDGNVSAGQQPRRPPGLQWLQGRPVCRPGKPFAFAADLCLGLKNRKGQGEMIANSLQLVSLGMGDLKKFSSHLILSEEFLVVNTDWFGSWRWAHSLF